MSTDKIHNDLFEINRTLERSAKAMVLFPKEANNE